MKRIIQIFIFLMVLQASILYCQSNKKKYEGTGSVSEFVMPSQAKVIGHFDLFYETQMPNLPDDKRSFWYKMVFNKDCFFKFNLFPLLTTDRYDFRLYKIPENLNFCYAITENKIESITNVKVKREFADSAQSKEFRAGLVYIKEVQVKRGDAIYIEIVNLWGSDIGHIIDFNTCDYSYVLKATKEGAPVIKADSSKLEAFDKELKSNLSEGIANIKEILCPENGKVIQLSSITFNPKGVDIIPKYSLNGYESQTLPGTKAILPVKTGTASISSVKFNTPPKSSVTTETVSVAKKDSLLYKPVRIRSKIIDSIKGVAVDVAIKIIDELTGKEVAIAKTGKPGEYLFNVDNTKKYRVECTAIGYKPFEKTIEIADVVTKTNSNIFNLKLEPLTAGQTFILRNIQFHANTYVTKSQSKHELDRLYKYMKDNPTVIIEISGHTNGNKKIAPDPLKAKLGKEWSFSGSSKKLSYLRALEIKEYLTKKGIDGKRIKVEGYGGNKPLIPDANTQEQMQKNMRVEVLLLKA
ncbi:MAG: OmpA family protein [Bacteroidetes bacterium]|nr:OmpA family protein [Bacteroidota bacterium]